MPALVGQAEGLSLPEAAARAETVLLTALVEQASASGRRWLMFTLTCPQGASRERLLDAHHQWRATVAARLRLPEDGLTEYRVVEPHLSGAWHLHGLIALPPRLPPGLAQVGLKYGLLRLATEDWLRIARIPPNGQAYAARIEPLGRGGARYCAAKVRGVRVRGVRVDGWERDYLGDWSWARPTQDDHEGATRPVTPSPAPGRPPDASRAARRVIDWLAEQGLRDSATIAALVAHAVGHGWFSQATFMREKARAGWQSVVAHPAPGKFRRGRWAWAPRRDRKKLRTASASTCATVA